MRSRGRREETAEDAAMRLVQQHAAELLRFARRFSHCADDAHDAYQRTIEILVRRLRSDPPAHPLAWVRTVLRHEALAVRREREQLLGRDEVDLDRHEGRHLEDPAERAVGHERLRHTAEALQRLKPQEVMALVLRAEGLSYREICIRTGWTYTRTNRAVSEGRRALLQRLGAIESGAECERWLPLLSALADGEATRDELAQLRPHLRACPACRGTLRRFHAAPAQVAALVPPVLVPLASGPASPLLGHVELALHAVAERATLLAMRVQGAVDGVPGLKLAAVAASTAALAGGGAVLEQAAHPGHGAHPAAQIADTPRASAGSARLLTIAAPLPSASAAAAAPASRGRRSASPRGEFAAARTSPSEFAPHAPAAAEFASASADASEPGGGPPSPAAMASAPSPTASPPSAPSAPSEFGGP
jgi:RNA polymerase sigma factor (sigma-70 family)